MKLYKDININKDLENLFNKLLNDIVFDNIYSLFEYFFLRKICIKHYNLSCDNFSKYTNELAQFLTLITNNNKDNNIKSIEYYFIRHEYIYELNFVCGYLNYIGIENIIKRDLLLSLEKLKISFKATNCLYRKIFIYPFIYKIRLILFKEQKLITEEKYNKTANKVFQLYNDSLKQYNCNNFSSSFFIIYLKFIKIK